MKFLVRMIISAFALIAIAYLSNGALLDITGETLGERFLPSFFAAIALAVVNATLRPIARLLALPVRILTLGLFGLVINAAMLYIVAWVVPGFGLVGFWQTVLVSIVMSIVAAVAAKIADED